MDARILVFTTQAAATGAVTLISATMGLTGSTFLFAVPTALADGRYSIPHPTDDAWLAGVTGYTTADGTGLVAVGEGLRPSTVVDCLALRDRFTNAELTALTLGAAAAMTGGDPRLQMLIDTMGAAVQLNLPDARVQTAFAGLVAAGILTTARANAILTPVGMLP